MSKSWWVILSVILLLSDGAWINARHSVDAQDLYERVTQGLIDIKKKHPASTVKIYTMLDQVEKLYSHVKQTHSESLVVKQELQRHHDDNCTLKNENEVFKNRLAKAKKSLTTAKSIFEKTTRRLEREKKRIKELEGEQKTLLARISQLEAGESKDEKNAKKKDSKEDDRDQELLAHLNHNFKRSSTSEPSSP